MTTKLDDKRAAALGRKIFDRVRRMDPRHVEDNPELVRTMRRIFVAGFVVGNNPEALLPTELGDLYLEA